MLGDVKQLLIAQNLLVPYMSGRYSSNKDGIVKWKDIERTRGAKHFKKKKAKLKMAKKSRRVNY